MKSTCEVHYGLPCVKNGFIIILLKDNDIKFFDVILKP